MLKIATKTSELKCSICSKSVPYVVSFGLKHWTGPYDCRTVHVDICPSCIRNAHADLVRLESSKS